MFPFVSVPHQNHCLLYIELLCFHIFVYISFTLHLRLAYCNVVLQCFCTYTTLISSLWWWWWWCPMSIHFFGCLFYFFSHWYSSVMLLLAAVRFPFLIHARTNLVSALLFCQPVSFLDIEYHAQSHFSSYHVLLLATIFLTMSFLLWWFVFHLRSSSIKTDKTTHYRLKAVYGNPSQSYGAPTVVRDHTVLPATRHRWTCPALTPARQVQAGT